MRAQLQPVERRDARPSAWFEYEFSGERGCLVFGKVRLELGEAAEKAKAGLTLVLVGEG